MSRKLRVLVLMDCDLVPPESMDGYSDEEMLDWKSEYDVCVTLEELGHEVHKLGVTPDLALLHQAIRDVRPHVCFNLMEEFHGVAVYEPHIPSYLELLRQPYTGCNPRGLMLAHDKALAKQILSHRGIPTPRFVVCPWKRRFRPPRGDELQYPLLVKSAVEDASLGITLNSVVDSERQLRRRVQQVHEELLCDALIEEYIEGREIYVGVLGNRRLRTLPLWELRFRRLPRDTPNIATAQVKWDFAHQKKVGVHTKPVLDFPASRVRKIQQACRQVYGALHLSGYARIDLRVTKEGVPYVLEANPNPNLSYGEDLAESAETDGISYAALLQKIVNLGLAYEPEWQRE